jgi:allantoinase
MPPQEFILSSRNVVTPEAVVHAGIHIRDGRIVALLEPSAFPRGIPVEDARDLTLMPGLVDTHVHINEPGRADWEGFETATKAAAAGGITTLVEMPLNSSPVTTTVEAYHTKTEAARGKLWVDCGFYAGVIPENASSIAPLLESGVFGVKAFLISSGIDEFPNVTAGDLRAALPAIVRSGLPLLVHCELSERPPGVYGTQRLYSAYLASRPDRWELDAISLMIDLCREFRNRLHIVHLSSA